MNRPPATAGVIFALMANEDLTLLAINEDGIPAWLAARGQRHLVDALGPQMAKDMADRRESVRYLAAFANNNVIATAILLLQDGWARIMSPRANPSDEIGQIKSFLKRCYDFIAKHNLGRPLVAFFDHEPNVRALADRLPQWGYPHWRDLVMMKKDLQHEPAVRMDIAFAAIPLEKVGDEIVKDLMVRSIGDAKDAMVSHSDPAQVAEHVMRAYSEASKATGFVAELDGFPAGLGVAVISSSNNAEGLFAGSLPEYRGRGLAKQIVSAMVTWAQEQGAPAFLVESDARNSSWIHVLEQNAMVQVSRQIHFKKHGD